ncbi:phage protein NinX family protein [Erwinia aphidicola]|uniref:phage protein NinX family protein n=1 Tax=Erwinia aphidicola TaxID=68334 RepID=UPI003D218C22
MDYSKLSDFEISILVAKVGGHIPLDESQGWAGTQKEPFTAVIVKGAHIIGGFDPCNNPADAWPIIFNNGIGLRKQSNGIWSCSQPGGNYPQYSENPLRAAMIVYLMMQESE